MKSFRDPDGICVIADNKVLRYVTREAEQRVRVLLACEFFIDLQKQEFIPKTWEISGSDRMIADQYLDEVDVDQYPLVLQHQKIPFISYPNEWSEEMLFDAGLLTLQLQKQALSSGYELKDATPLNIVFHKSRPVFVDILSFSPVKKDAVIWAAYAQFMRTFYFPLFRFKKTGIPVQGSFLERRDGIEPEELAVQMSFISKISIDYLKHVAIPTWLNRDRTNGPKGTAISERFSRFPQDEAKGIRALMLDSLTSAFRRNSPQRRDKSTWIGYMQYHSYKGGAFELKTRFVEDAIRNSSPGSVIDIGCNTGHFSELAARQGANVISIDYDHSVIDSLYLHSKKCGLSITPLVVNISWPTPSIGWANSEQTSFLERASEGFDFGLLLAVIHHIAITDGVPYSSIFRLVHKVVRVGLVAEFIPADDPMSKILLTNKEHLIPSLTKNEFENAFSPWFSIKKTQSLPNSERILYHLERLSH